jgi:hypothetical protein
MDTLQKLKENPPLVFRFKNLTEHNIVQNWSVLSRLMNRRPEDDPFPRGFPLSDYTTGWDAAAVIAWVERQMKKPPRPNTRVPRGRRGPRRHKQEAKAS